LRLKIFKFAGGVWYNVLMIEAFLCTALSGALEKLKLIVREREESGKKTVIFCEDRLSLFKNSEKLTPRKLKENKSSAGQR